MNEGAKIIETSNTENPTGISIENNSESIENDSKIEKPRNQHLKKVNPKSVQITFRVTDAENNKIKAAIEAQKKKQKLENYNAGNLMLDMIHYLDVDLFATFKIK